VVADVRVVVVDVDELRRIIVEAVRSAASERPAPDEWVDARTSGLGRRRFLRLAREGAFPVSRRGRAYIARRSDVDAYLERQRVEHSPTTPASEPPPPGSHDPIAAALAAGRLRLVKKSP
jgi:hypothetical protein